MNSKWTALLGVLVLVTTSASVSANIILINTDNVAFISESSLIQALDQECGGDWNKALNCKAHFKDPLYLTISCSSYLTRILIDPRLS
jgi:hypothetical protein